MCMTCVAEGRMTQAELDQHNANQTDGADFAAVRAALGQDPASFLAQLLSGQDVPELDPEADAQDLMDGSVKILLEFIASENEKHGTPETSLEMAAATERDAGRLMYKCRPATIAVTLSTITRRYAILLEQWATLYARAAIGDDDTIDLDAATTAEAKAAVTRATREPEHRTGMYI